MLRDSALFHDYFPDLAYVVVAFADFEGARPLRNRTTALEIGAVLGGGGTATLVDWKKEECNFAIHCL